MRAWVRVAWPAAMLLLFFAAVREAPGWARPVAPPLDCRTIGEADAGTIERCLVLHPRDVALLTWLGDAYARQGRLDRAEPLYRRAIDADSSNGDLHVRLGELLLRRGDPSAALQEGRVAAAVQPGRHAVLDLIARASAERE